MTDYCYNQYIGPETLDKEYKLFTLHFLGTNLDPHNESCCEDLIKTGKWIFNKSVIENMEYYIEYYLPKYTSSFLQDSFEMDQSEMFFGVTNSSNLIFFLIYQSLYNLRSLLFYNLNNISLILLLMV